MICAGLLKDLAAIVAKHAPEPHSPVDAQMRKSVGLDVIKYLFGGLDLAEREKMLLEILAYLLREPFLHKPQGGNSCALARTKRAGGAE